MKTPNIIVILADDMGYSDIGCFGSEINTPNLDKLANNGVRYTQMYNNARCCPSRACLLTGVHPHQAGVGHMVENVIPFDEYQGYLNSNCLTIAEALKLKNYNTAMTGKWHVGGNYWKEDKTKVIGTKGYPTPLQRGFDNFYGILEGAGDYYNPITLMENDNWLYPKAEDDFYLTEKITQKSCEYINSMSQKNSPFFLYVSYTAPHWPLHARKKYIDKYKNTYNCGWDEIRKSRHEKQLNMGLFENKWDMSPRDEKAMDWEDVDNKELEAFKMAVYAAQVEHMDAGIGEIVAELESQGIKEDTLILFMSDNGGCAEELPQSGWIMGCANEYTLTGEKVDIGNKSTKMPGGQDTYMSYGLPWANASNTPFRLFKHWIHEGGVSTPLIANWDTGIKDKGKITATPLHFTDIMSTILDVAGVKYPKIHKEHTTIALQGESFSPSFNSNYNRKNPIFWEHEGNCGMRNLKYKLVKKYGKPYELYDMVNDRTELNDLSKHLPDICKNMIKEYSEWATKTGVRDWDEVSTYYK